MDPTQKKIRVLLIGLGRMGAHHFRALRENEKFEVVGIVDPAPSVGTEGVPIYRALNGGVPRPDAAIVASPAGTHPQIAAQLGDRQIPTLIEKPISLSSELGPYALYMGRRVAVGHIERFNPAVAALAVMLPAFGTIERIFATRTGGEIPPDAGARGGVAFDLAVHDLDICRQICGKLRVEFATCDVNRAHINLMSQGGVYIEVVAGWGGDKCRTLEVEGSLGRATLDYAKQTLVLTQAGDEPAHQEIIVKKSEPLRAEHDAFAHFVQTGVRGALASPEDAMAVVRLAEHATSAHGFV